MDILRTNHLQQTVVMGDDNAGGFRGSQFVHAFSHNTHGIYIQTGIRLVEDAQLRFQHRHLENLITFLLTATESFIHRTVGKFGIQLHNLTFLTHQLEKIGSLQRVLPFILALCIDGSLHEIGHRDTRNLHGILEREE